MFRVNSRTINKIMTFMIIAVMLFTSVGRVQAVTVGNDTVDFVGVRYDYPNPGEATWYYKVVSGGQPAISHILFELNLTCVQLVDAGTWNGVDQNDLTSGGGNPVIGQDGSTGYTGLKFDQSFQTGETRYYYFTTDRNYVIDNSITILSKGGNGFDTAVIAGPSAVCDYYPPNPAPGIDIEKNINSVDVDDAPGLAVTEGDTLTFDFVVTNTGNVNLENVVVNDNVFGEVCTFALLPAGETVSCSVQVAAVVGQHTNVAAVSGSTPLNGGQTVTDSDPANYFGSPQFVPAPAIDIEKSVNGDDADEAPGIEVIEGDTVTFSFVVTNTGNVDLSNVAVSDDVLGSVCAVASLAVGESATCTVDALAVVGLHTNVGTAAGEYNGTSVGDSDPANYTGTPRFIPNPIIDIEKLINGEDVDEAPGLAVTEGDVLTFEFVVTNSGNVPLSDVNVTDNVFGAICSFGTLAAGETATCSFQQAAGVGLHTNVGTATATYENTGVSDSDPANYTAEPRFIPLPSLDIEKLINGQDADTAPGVVVYAGDTLTYEFIVTNTGNVTLTNVEVTDDKLGPICVIAELAVGANSSCSITGTAAEVWGHMNIGTAASTYGSSTVSDSDPAHYTGKARPAPKPGIAIKKQVNGQFSTTSPGITVPVGSTVTFTYRVANIGTAVLTNVIVGDNMIGIICTIPTLNPGQTVTCTATQTAVAGQYMNIGKASTWYGDPKNGGVKVTATHTAYYFGQ